MTFLNFLGLNKIYNPSDIEYITNVAMYNERLRSKKKVLYFDTPCAFDIETTSFISYNLEKYEYANYFNVCTNEIDNIDIQNIQGISSLDIKDNILLVTTGKRKFPKYDDEGNIKEVETKANESNFQFWKI